MDSTLLAAILSPFMAGIITIIIKKYFSGKPKLIVYYGYIAAHKFKITDPVVNVTAPVENITVPEKNETGRVNTHSIIIKNIGKVSTQNVRIGHAYLPDYTIMPPTNYSVSKTPDNREEIILPILAPNEELTISYLYFPPVTFGDINTYVKSDDGLANIIRVIPSPELLGWKKSILYILLFFGITAAVFLSMMLATGIYYLTQCCKLMGYFPYCSQKT